MGRRSAALARRSDTRRFLTDGRRLSTFALPPCSDAARHSLLRWTVLRLGSRARSNHVVSRRYTSNRDRPVEITDCSRIAIWFFPRRLSLRKRAARRVDQSDSPRRGAEHPGRDSNRLSVLPSSLCLQCKPLHAILHGADRPFSDTDRLSVPLAYRPCSLESSIRHSRSRSTPHELTSAGLHRPQSQLTTL